MLISEKYNTQFRKYISRELVETLERTANCYGVLVVDVGMLWVLMQPTYRCVMGAYTAASVPVHYGRPSVASPGFWLRRGMDIHSYTCGAVSTVLNA